MAEITNPVKRLYSTMEAFSHEISTGKRVRAVLAANFKIDASDDVAMMNILVDWINLCEEAKNIFKKVDQLGENEDYLEYFDQASKYILSCFNHLDSTGFGQIAASTRSGLKFCSDIVVKENINTEECIDEGGLLELMREAYNNRERLINENIDEKLKDILIWNYKNIENSITEYSLHGVDGLREAVDLAFTSIVRLKDKLGDQSDENEKAAFDLLSFAYKMDQLVARVSPYASLVPFIPAGTKVIRALLGP
jgi:hypothetical protein